MNCTRVALSLNILESKFSARPDLTGEICTKRNERESTWRKTGHAPTEVQTRTDRDDAATD